MEDLTCTELIQNIALEFVMEEKPQEIDTKLSQVRNLEKSMQFTEKDIKLAYDDLNLFESFDQSYKNKASSYNEHTNELENTSLSHKSVTSGENE
jgi:hypothetical protein